jgi:hypothetical protein
LILIRPEGFFIAVVWGVYLLFSNSAIRDPQSAIRLALLGLGMVFWWASAYVITGDPLWIVHDWPHDWQADGKFNGTGPIWWYLILLPLIVGPLLLPPFLFGLIVLLKRKRFLLGIASFLSLLIIHSVMYWRGWFGSAGYARYLVCISPAISILVLAGWNNLSKRPGFDRPLGSAVVVLSILFCLCYVDGWRPTRDALAVEAMHDWFEEHPFPISRLITSQAYMRIIFNRDPRENLPFGSDRMKNLDLIKTLAPGTLVFWDENTGEKWFKLGAEDFKSAGFTKLKSQEFRLEGRFFRLPREGYGGVQIQRMHLFYRERK